MRQGAGRGRKGQARRGGLCVSQGSSVSAPSPHEQDQTACLWAIGGDAAALFTPTAVHETNCSHSGTFCNAARHRWAAQHMASRLCPQGRRLEVKVMTPPPLAKAATQNTSSESPRTVSPSRGDAAPGSAWGPGLQGWWAGAQPRAQRSGCVRHVLAFWRGRCGRGWWGGLNTSTRSASSPGRARVRPLLPTPRCPVQRTCRASRA